MLIGFICLHAICSLPVQAQSKEEKKAIQKELKALEKDGWKSTKSGGLSLAMTKHSENMVSNPNLRDLSGVANGSKTIRIGEAKAREDVISQFVDYCGGMVKARITSDVRDVNDVQADNIVAGYERILAQAMERSLIPSYYRYKEINGGYDVFGYFFYDSNVIAQKSNDALKQACEEAGVAFDYGNQISDFINQGFKQ